MEKKKYTYFEEDGMFIGWLDDFPDYKTQGETLEELTDNLRDIYIADQRMEDLSAGRSRTYTVDEVEARLGFLLAD